ncbi:MAG: hypothetical protein ABI867_26315 [Kofleriaceae bacterium]
MRALWMAVMVTACANDYEAHGRSNWGSSPPAAHGPMSPRVSSALVTLDEDGWHMWSPDASEGDFCRDANTVDSTFELRFTRASTERTGTVPIALELPGDDEIGATLTIESFRYVSGELIFESVGDRLIGTIEAHENRNDSTMAGTFDAGFCL